jgi:2-C-methyl-D-erythritol 2,4-cyclodiphosphate synthase
VLLEHVLKLIAEKNYGIVNIDAIIVMEKPKLSPYKSLIKEKIARVLGLPVSKVNIKATTNEKMGFIGRGEGTAVHSVCMLKEI